MNSNSIKIVNDLTQMIGVSGEEKRVSQYLAHCYQGLCDEIVYDNLGSVFAVKKANKENAKRVMVCAHMDEVGFMITEIHANGLLSFIKLGSIEDSALYGNRVRIQTRTKEVWGTICADDETVKNGEAKKMKIDVGATDKDQVCQMGIMVGDSAVFTGEFVTLTDQRIMSKALDSRFGCALTIELLQAVQEKTFDFDLYIGASVMEEVGQRGGTTAAGLIHPDLGIVLDGGSAQDFSGKENEVGQLGQGVLVRYYDKGMMPNRGLLEELVNTCKKQDIDYQYYYSMALTDSAWIHKLFSGCPTLTLGVCSRNGHTGNVVMDTHDYTCAKKALISIVNDLSEVKIQGFKEYNR